MFVYNDVNESYRELLPRLKKCPIEETRNGKAKVLTTPIAVTHVNPLSRVLMDKDRDANPFFHMMEAIWMLAGRNDVAFLSQFNSNIANYSDDGRTFHGAYGHRWQHHFGYNQLITAVADLTDEPTSRRIVVSMWDPREDPDYAREGGKDVPCNTHFKLRTTVERGARALHMTVFNRSNDLVWGMLGANYVHFSFLLEALAHALDMEVGYLCQVSADLHLYERHWDLEPSDELLTVHCPKLPFDPTLEDCRNFCEDPLSVHTNPFLRVIARPMFMVWRAYKQKAWDDCAEYLSWIDQRDWFEACSTWIDKRYAKWNSQNPYVGEEN